MLLSSTNLYNRNSCPYIVHHCVCLVTQLCPTLCNPMDCSPLGSSFHGDSPGKNTGVGCHALLQGIFPTQGSNSDLLHCGQILYHLGHQRSPIHHQPWFYPQMFFQFIHLSLSPLPPNYFMLPPPLVIIISS